jgi:site-specific DNA-methyltransferase (adenine-specific)
MPISIVENRDCMEAMKEFPDKFFELAIVDPEYRDNNQPTQQMRRKGDMKKWKGKCNKDYFLELFRVSKNQIIWGGNYYTYFLEENNNWIIWYKNNDGTGFSMCEMAWSSIRKNIKLFELHSPTALQSEKFGRIHPTQKPIALYQWLLKNYAKPGDKILDTHLGSGSSRIAAYKMGFDFWGYEIDKDYFDAQEKRFKEAIAQPLFDSVKPEQGFLL